MSSWIKSIVGDDAYTFERGLLIVLMGFWGVAMAGAVVIAGWVTFTGG